MARRRRDGRRQMEGNEDRYSARVGDFADSLPIYIVHYVFDLWVDVWRAKCAQGEVVVVRYADNTV